jgi:hypothetical protein
MAHLLHPDEANPRLRDALEGVGQGPHGELATRVHD